MNAHLIFITHILRYWHRIVVDTRVRKSLIKNHTRKIWNKRKWTINDQQHNWFVRIQHKSAQNKEWKINNQIISSFRSSENRKELYWICNDKQHLQLIQSQGVCPCIKHFMPIVLSICRLACWNLHSIHTFLSLLFVYMHRIEQRTLIRRVRTARRRLVVSFSSAYICIQ